MLFSPRQRTACHAAWCCRSCRRSSRHGRPGPWQCSRYLHLLRSRRNLHSGLWETEDGRLRTHSTHIKGQITYSSTHLHSVPTLQRLKWELFRVAVMLLWHLSSFQTQLGQTRWTLPRHTYYNYNVWMSTFTSQRSCYILALNGFDLE